MAAVVIMAAGAGTRMKSATAKVLHPLAGRSMLSYAVEAASALEPENLVVVIGHQRDQVKAHLDEIAPQVVTAVQEEPRGTGDAVRSGLSVLGELTGDVVVTSGDVPLLTGDTLRELLEAHRLGGNAVTVLTTIAPDPTGYGRIVREGGQVAGSSSSATPAKPSGGSPRSTPASTSSTPPRCEPGSRRWAPTTPRASST
ncbi:MAG: NTP transferase domain-containing protein [Micropruina sp.]